MGSEFAYRCAPPARERSSEAAQSVLRGECLITGAGPRSQAVPARRCIFLLPPRGTAVEHPRRAALYDAGTVGGSGPDWLPAMSAFAESGGYWIPPCSRKSIVGPLRGQISDGRAQSGGSPGPERPVLLLRGERTAAGAARSAAPPFVALCTELAAGASSDDAPRPSQAAQGERDGVGARPGLTTDRHRVLASRRSGIAQPAGPPGPLLRAAGAQPSSRLELAGTRAREGRCSWWRLT